MTIAIAPLVRIERFLAGGARLARDDQGAILVDDGVPGDVVTLTAMHKKRGARFARVATVVTPSDDRVAADCHHHPRCGGCNWLDVRFSSHGDHKRAMVIDVLRRVGRVHDDELAVVKATQSPPCDQGQRRRARMVVGTTGRLSFAAGRSHERIEVDHCAALAPKLNELLVALSSHPSHRLTVGATVHVAVDDHGVVAATPSPADAAVLAPWVRGVLVEGGAVGDPYTIGEVTSGRWPARSDALSFTQATRFGGGAILDAVLEAVPTSAGRVIELFAGAGHITLPLAARGHAVVAVEGDARGIGHLHHNRALVPGAIEVHHSFIDGRLPVPTADVLVVDPPRTGMLDVTTLLKRIDPAVVVMVSCDPATGARDLALVRAAGFDLVSLVPVDAFPRTHHVEWVASLHRRQR